MSNQEHYQPEPPFHIILVVFKGSFLRKPFLKLLKSTFIKHKGHVLPSCPLKKSGLPTFYFQCKLELENQIGASIR
jgi:hypothetical protein